MNKKDIVTCPVCGREYLLSEIFIPAYLLTKAEFIKRDMNGKIIDYVGMPAELTECYTCDQCDSVLKVKLSMTADVNIDAASNSEYEMKLPTRLAVKEF